MSIKNIGDFVSLFPPGSVIQDRSEYHSPCPFCTGSMQSASIMFNGFAFWGTDRLVWRLRDNSFWCRHCAMNSRGRNGNYYAWELAQLFKQEFDPALTTPVPIERQPIRFWTVPMVLTAHAQVDREFWYRFGWDDMVIDHFRLGLGTLYEVDGAVNLIPMNVRTVRTEADRNLYYVSGRNQGVYPKRLSGDNKLYFWHIVEDRENSSIVLCEGEKDAITAWVLGYRNIVVSFGTHHWDAEKTQFLRDFGYTNVVCFGDNDEAGDAFNRRVASWCAGLNISCTSLDWQKHPINYDLTDLLLDYGADGAQNYILGNQRTYNVTPFDYKVRPTFVAQFTDLVPTYQPEVPHAMDLEELRGTGENSIYGQTTEFLKTYQSKAVRGRGVLKLLNAPPGSGKTHAIIRIAEREAYKAIHNKEQERDVFEDEIKSIEHRLEHELYESDEEKQSLLLLKKRLEKNLKEFSVASVMVATQFKNGYDDLMEVGANGNLWYNYRARDNENCVNFNTVTKLGDNNHDIGAFCATVCPFAARCKESGYLAQEAERKKKPITVFRHQHLLNKGMLNEYKNLVIIDENPFHILEEPLLIAPDDVLPHRRMWQMDIDDDYVVECIIHLADGLASAIRSNSNSPQYINGDFNSNYIISGAAFLKRVDSFVKEKTKNAFDLSMVVRAIPTRTLADFYHPTFRGGDAEKIQKRCIHVIHEALLRELKFYDENPENKLPSMIHLVNGKLEIYQLSRLQISSNVPIVEADATAMIPELYAKVFHRTLDIFSPEIHNENARTIVVRGTDWTLSEINKQIGTDLKDRQRQSSPLIYDFLGEPFDLTEVPINPNLYNSRILKDAKDLILYLASQHESLFVVTHKRIREVLEEIVKASNEYLAQNIAFGHYQALRGTNAYKNYQAVVLIGMPRIPYDVLWRRIQAWAALLEIGDEIPFELKYQPSPYHTQNSGHTHLTFTHPFARLFVEMVENGEMIQCEERIRPHATDDKKYVYICANRPSGRYINSITTKSALLSFYRSDSKVNQIKTFILNRWREQQKLPSKSEITKRFQCGYDTYKQAKISAEAELGGKFPERN